MGYKIIEESIGKGDHLCAFYENKTEQFQVVLPFLVEGLAKHEKCLYIADENSVAEIKAGLLMHGVDVDLCMSNSQLLIVTSRETYLRSGRFVADDMISFLQSLVEKATEEGFAGFRAAGETTWLLRELRNIEEFFEYENALNDALTGLPVKLLCQYNTKKFFGDFIVNILKTHPRVLLGLELYENPFWIHPKRQLNSELQANKKEVQ